MNTDLSVAPEIAQLAEPVRPGQARRRAPHRRPDRRATSRTSPPHRSAGGTWSASTRTARSASRYPTPRAPGCSCCRPARRPTATASRPPPWPARRSRRPAPSTAAAKPPAAPGPRPRARHPRPAPRARRRPRLLGHTALGQSAAPVLIITLEFIIRNFIFPNGCGLRVHRPQPVVRRPWSSAVVSRPCSSCRAHGGRRRRRERGGLARPPAGSACAVPGPRACGPRSRLLGDIALERQPRPF